MTEESPKVRIESIRCECGVKQGQIHEWGCSQERCPFCGGLLLSCGCVCKHLGLSMPKNVMECLDVTFGLSQRQLKKWLGILDKKRRVPFICWPNVCSYCGCSLSERFMVPDQEWEHYIEIRHRNDVVCPSCYMRIREMIDEGTGKPYTPKADVMASVQEMEKHREAYLNRTLPKEK